MSQKNPDDELFERLEAVERARRKRAMIVGALVAVAVVGGFVASFTFQEEVFRPELDVQSGEKDVIAETNDPQCRTFIADVTAIGKDYVALEPQLEGLLGDDPEATKTLIADLDAIKVRLADAREQSAEAELRFDNSRSELKEWFRYIDNELTLLQRVGKDKLAETKPPEPDAGTLVEDGNAPKSEKSMPDRLSGATLAASEAFQKFRVWHTGGLHPCGAAAEGETGWTPPAEAAKPASDKSNQAE